MLYVSLKDELDAAGDGAERITPAGSIFEAYGQTDGLYDLVCTETGGWVRVTDEELAADFEAVPIASS